MGKTPESRENYVKNYVTLPPDLQAVVDTWDSLPEAVKAGIVAMVKAAKVPK